MAGYKNDEQSLISKLLPHKGESASLTARKIVTLFCFVVLIASIAILAWYFVQHAKIKSDTEAQRAQHTSTSTAAPTEVTTTVPTETTTAAPTETEPPPLVVMDSMQSFVDENPHTAGWLKISNTNIDNVVLQNDTNDYYIDHDFDGNYNVAGQLYVDYRCVVNDYNENQSDNIIIYGHNQADGTMFGTLKKYKMKKVNTNNFDFYLENPTFTFGNLYEEYTYKIIAIFIIEVDPKHNPDGVVFDYHNYVNFTQKRPFETFKQNLLDRTAVNTGVDFNEDDKYMTLSTCSNEFEPSRLVVIGRRVRDGESPEVDTSLAEINEDMLEPDYEFIYNQ